MRALGKREKAVLHQVTTTPGLTLNQLIRRTSARRAYARDVIFRLEEKGLIRFVYPSPVHVWPVHSAGGDTF